LGEGVGVVLDVYHVWWDPELSRQMERAAGKIVGFHICDWLVPTTDLVFDRGMPGDGVIDILGISQMVDATGYAGFVEVELLSRRWWAEEPDEILRIVKERHARVV
jgi:sugar phosphate isomerase/epimerase